MKRIQEIMKNKTVLIVASGVILLALVIVIVCIAVNHDQPQSQLKTTSSEGNTSVNLENGDNQSDPGPNPNNSKVTSQNNNSSSQNTTSVSPQKPPSTTITVDKDKTESKNTTPSPSKPADPTTPGDDWPPPPGTGMGDLISEGFDKVPVNPDKSVETEQENIASVIKNHFAEDKVYNSFDAGEVMDFVLDGVKNYAKTGTVNLNPSKFGLPKVTGQYQAKIQAKGTNAQAAGDYVYDYLKSDQTFQSKLKGEFGNGNYGYLSVYQKGGYYYILAVMVDLNGTVY